MGNAQTCVLMSTYNGEKYLTEQIDSILNQINADIELMIRDDGSSDGTINICEEYAAKYKNVTFYSGKNIGVGMSFIDLLYKAPEAEYYSYADQDDVWLSDKTERAISAIEYKKRQKGYSLPLLYTSNQIVVDKDLVNLGMRFSEEPRHDIYQEIAFNNLSGCTMVMNKELRKVLIQHDNQPNNHILNTRIHDTWTMLVALIAGEVIYDNESRILYRQHENNVVGAHKKNVCEILKDKYDRFMGEKYKGNRSKLAEELINIFGTTMKDEQKRKIELIARCKTLKGTIDMINNEEVRSAFKESNVILLIKGITGWI